MTDKENVLRIINFDNPERILSEIPCYRLQYFGCDHESFDGQGGHDSPVGTRWQDIWGVTWHKEQEGLMGYAEGHPLSDPSKLDLYKWPDPDDPRLVEPLHRLAAEPVPEDHFLASRHRDTLWERAYMLVGMEIMMMSFYTNPGFAREVLRRIMDFQIGIAEHYLRYDIEITFLGDDLGTQNGPLLGPQIVEDFLVPEYTRLFRVYKDRNVLVNWHSCGNVDSFLQTFMDLGVDILNPVQATANNLKTLREKTQGKLALQGGISTAIIMEGPVQRIREEVREKIGMLGKKGGYFCDRDQNMPFPEAHVDALNQAVGEFGRYPLP